TPPRPVFATYCPRTTGSRRFSGPGGGSGARRQGSSAAVAPKRGSDPGRVGALAGGEESVHDRGHGNRVSRIPPEDLQPQVAKPVLADALCCDVPASRRNDVGGGQAV